MTSRTSDIEAVEMTGAEAADMARRYYELKKVEGDLKRQLEAMNEVLRQHIEKRGEPIKAEGIPLLKLSPRRTGLKWDSAAIENLMRHKEEWQRLVELGCVGLNASTVKEALKNGNLAAIPEGGYEGESWALTFDKER